MKEVIVIGSGGHAKVVIDILQSMADVRIIGVTSESLKAGSVFLGYPVIGDDSQIKDYSKQQNVQAAMGLGGFKDNALREKVFNHIRETGMKFMTLIHPSAIISRSVEIGEGAVIFPGVILNTEVRIGKNTIIATASTVDHESVVGDHVLISAGVTIGAYTNIGNNALLALGSKVVSGISIGHHTLIGAGAVVVNSIEARQRAFGIPAKIKN